MKQPRVGYASVITTQIARPTNDTVAAAYCLPPTAY